MDHQPQKTMTDQIRDKIEDACLAQGICPTTTLLDELERIAEDSAFPIAGRYLSDLIAKLAPADQAKWLRVMDTGPSLSEASKAIGISKVSLHKQEHRLRRRLTIGSKVDESNTTHGPCRPNQIQTRSKNRRASKPAR
jgi:DNA-directed RNA polymerase specialized sigma24 family protein